MEFLQWLENLRFSAWIRESGSIWSYPLVLTLHTVGLGIVVGISCAVDLRILGVARAVPLRPFEKFFPLMWWGFWINAASGLVLLMADATTKMTNWLFYVKLGLILAALLVQKRIDRHVFRSDDAGAAERTLAWYSLVLWTLAITAGRLTAYIGPVSGLPGAVNKF